MPGPFYFAWISGPEDFNLDYHMVNDEDVLSININHLEGDFPQLSIVVRNPRVGLLSRDFWAWLSFDKNWPGTPDIVPLFLGRLVGIPNTINKEMVTLEFIARPVDLVDQREAIADGLRVLPYWDPVWVAADKWSDPDTLLEGYTKLWHFDRITHQASVSDIVVGEDGLEEFQESEIPYESVELSLGQAPFRSVRIEGTTNWSQKFDGRINVAKGSKQTINSNIFSEWPKDGVSLGGGYTAKNSWCKDLLKSDKVTMKSYSTSWSNPARRHSPGDTMSANSSGSYPDAGAPIAFSWEISRKTYMGVGKASIEIQNFYIVGWKVSYNLDVKYEIARERTEVASFLMESNIQPILSDESEVEIHEIKISSNNVDQPNIAEELPIGDVKLPSYFDTERGQYSLQYLMCLGRAALVSAARCVEVKCTIPFARALDLSCRKNAIIHDSRLPGGQALGKVKEYSIFCDGTTGEMNGTVTIASVIGYGNSIVTDPGSPSYVEEGYVELGYQKYDGETYVLPGGEIVYTNPENAGEDDGIRHPIRKKDILISANWINGSESPTAPGVNVIPPEFYGSTPQDELEWASEQAKIIVKNMEADPTYFRVRLRNLNKKFTSPYSVTVAPLELPKQIDLEFNG